jgi:hypothetical protein
MLAVARHSGHEKTGSKTRETAREKLSISTATQRGGTLYCCQDLNGVSGTGVSGGWSAAHAAILSTTS